MAGVDIPYPCFLKPVFSHRFRRHFEGKGVVVHTPKELERSYAEISAAGVRVLLTEIIQGVDDEYCSYYTYIEEDGEPLVHFTKRKIRQYPVGFGIGTYHVTRWEPEAADLGLRFARSVGLRGLVNVEFKRDRHDGALKLIECNPRLTAGNEVVRRAGVDFARIAYDRALGLPVRPLSGFREGVHQWTPSDDYRAFLQYMARGELSTGQWVGSLLHRQMIPLIAYDDLGPLVHRLSISFDKWSPARRSHFVRRSHQGLRSDQAREAL
jgi:predicted ATP-grasp superfamily ATP-dependent carboligase